MSDDLVSVLLPLYNRERTIAAAIESVLNQTHQHFELLVVDDASSDAGGRVAIEYAQADKRVRVFHHQTNRGATAARNTALRSAVGQWVTLLDSDDQLLPLSLELQLAAARQKGVHALHSDGLVLEPGAALPKRWNPSQPVEGYVYKRLLRGPATNGYFFISRLASNRLAQLDERVVAYQDWDLAIRLARHFELGWLNEATFVWDQRVEDTISRDLLREARGYEQVVRKNFGAIFVKCGPRVLADHFDWASSLYAGVGALADARRCKMLGRVIYPRPTRAWRGHQLRVTRTSEQPNRSD